MSAPTRGLGDPLLSLLRAERSLVAAAEQGEHVVEQLQDVRNSIREMIAARENDGGRHR